MKRSILTLQRCCDSAFQSVITTTHGRQIYIKVILSPRNNIHICNCFYTDRPGNPTPIKWKTKHCKQEDFLSVLSSELDKKFYGVEFNDNQESLSTEAFISHSKEKKKHRFLILIFDGDTLRTRLKNRTHRVIFLEIKRDGNTAFIKSCHYVDRFYKRDSSLITPASLNTIYFEYSLDAILKIVNNELNCDFTDVIVTADTFGFDKTRLPICGRI